MPNVSILFFTDPHNSDTPPRSRKEGYRDEILAKQEFLVPYAKEVSITIIGGDIFHQKKAHKISHFLISRLMEIYREYGVVYIIPGNHDFDMSPREIEHNPLGIIGRLPNVTILHGAYVSGVMGMDMYFAGLGGYPEEISCVEMLRVWEKTQAEINKDRSSVPYNIAVIHDAVTKKEYPFPTIPFDDVARYAELFFFGHMHNWQELGGKIVAPGALSRGVLEADNIDRNVGFALVDIDTDNRKHAIKGYKVPVKPSAEVFKVEERIAQKALESTVEEFLNHLETMKKDFKGVDVDAVISHINWMNLPNEVKEKAINILRAI